MTESERELEWLNYHHLRHFWVIARRRSLTQAARDLNISPSTLSQQLGELEAWLEHPLFERRGRQLHLTESGRVALEHADTIFQTGRELLDSFRRSGPERHVLRIGAVGPLSKNLQFEFILPLLKSGDTRVNVVAGPLHDLVRQLHEHKLDLLLSNIPLRADQDHNVFNHPLGEMPVFLAGRVAGNLPSGRFPHWLQGVPVFLPSRQSHVRSDFDMLLADAGVEPDIRAEVDEMSLLRLLALSGEGLALVPAIVVERELQTLEERSVFLVPGLVERFYAITIRRRFGNARIEAAVAQFKQTLKDMAVIGKKSARHKTR